MKESNLDERLLSAWLDLSSGVRNDRLVKTMSFNEVFICHILYNKEEGALVTATDIVERTGMIKSQVNKVLMNLEEKEFVSKVSFAGDKRKINIMLTKKGEKAYENEHKGVIGLIAKVHEKMGDVEATHAAKAMEDLADTMREIGGEA